MSHEPPTKPLPEKLKRAYSDLRAFALSFPEATEDFPWGHFAAKVAGKKGFVYLSTSDAGLSMSAKLPMSNAMALTFPFASPTEYGLGRCGWVTARFGPKDTPPVPMLKGWIEESFRAIAPKKIVKLMDAGGAAISAPAKKAKSVKRTAKKQ